MYDQKAFEGDRQSRRSVSQANHGEDNMDRSPQVIERTDNCYPLLGERFGVSVSTVENVARKLHERQSLELASLSCGPAALEGKRFHFRRDQLKANTFLSLYDLFCLYDSHFK